MARKDGNNYVGVLYNFGYWNHDDDIWESYSESIVMSDQGTTGYREPAYLTDYRYGDASNYNTVGITESMLQNEYNSMIESVKKYGGFFVGRYETSIDSTTVVASKEGTPMSLATDNQMWYGMYDKQKKFAGKNLDGTDNNDKMQSSMIWGSQYNAMLNWMQKGEQGAKVISTTNGNHSGSPTITGGTPKDIINNIYDLGGNLNECTIAAHNTDYRISMGGDYYYGNTPSIHNNCTPYGTSPAGGSRLSLYIK